MTVLQFLFGWTITALILAPIVGKIIKEMAR